VKHLLLVIFLVWVAIYVKRGEFLRLSVISARREAALDN
jgi:hypothetical protein